MMGQISYFILFGILSVTTGKPARDNRGDSHYVKNENDLQKLFQLLTNQGKSEVAINYREDGLSNHRSRAGSSRDDGKTRQIYDRNDKGESLQFYGSRDNADEDQSSINSLKIINQLLDRNDDKPETSLVEDLLSADRNKFRVLKASDKTNNVDDIVSFLENLQTNVANNGNYATVMNRKEKHNRNDVYDKSNIELPTSISEFVNPSRGRLFGEKQKQNLMNRVRSLLAQAKQGVMQLIQNIVGFKLRTANDDRYDLRCNGKSCARINGAVNNGNNNRLRCRGRSCAKYIDEDGDLTYDSKLRTKKIKVNDELDAVILGMTDVERLLTKLDTKPQRTNELTSDNLIENVDLEDLLNSKNSIDKKSNVEAIVFDLTQIENGDDVARQIKRLLTRNNEGSYDEYEDYGNVVADNIKQGIYDLGKLADSESVTSKKTRQGDNSETLFLPQWLLDEVVTRSKLKKQPVREQLIHSKSLFPLTRQQRERMANRNANKKQNNHRLFRRSMIDDVGVPFHLEVQGLGQVNP